MSVGTETWERIEHGDYQVGHVRRDGDTITFRGTSRYGAGFDAWVPMVPVWVELSGLAVASWAYLDSGTTTTYAPRSLVEGAGIPFDALAPSEGKLNGIGGSRLCPGRILLYDGTPMLEEEFLVPEREPGPVEHAYGAAFILGLDVFQRFDVCFSWRDSRTADAGDPPAFSLTPRSV